MPVRLVSESAWHSAFMHNILVRSDRDSLFGHIPEFTIPRTIPTVDPKEYGVNSEAFVVISLSKGLVLMGGTRYAGEIKNRFYHYESHPTCTRTSSDARSPIQRTNVCLFFGLSGTGKTTLSADPEGHWSVMMSIVGQTKAYSISRGVVMRR